MTIRWGVFILLISGCTTWVHPTKTRADFEMDTYHCTKDVPATADANQGYEITRRCMMLKGWRPQ